MGVIAELDVDYGRIYGPFPTVGHIPKSHFIGYLTADERHDSGNVKINLNDGYLGNTWLPYVQPARTVDEQNMEAYMKDGNIFYRTLRIIRAGEELLVWYSKDFAQILGIPFTTTFGQKQGDDMLKCPDCGDKCQFTYSMMAHKRFRCSKSLSQHSPGVTSCDTPRQHSPSVTRCDSPRQHSPRWNSSDSPGNEAMKKLSPTGTMSLSNIRISNKRKHEPEIEEQHKKVIVVETTEENNNNTKTTSDYSPKSDKDSAGRDFGSAFRKVEKSSPANISISKHDRLNSVESFDTKSEESRLNLGRGGIDLARALYKPTMVPATSVANGFSNGLGMLMSSWAVPSSSGRPAYIDPRLYGVTSPVLPVSKVNSYPTRMNVLSQDAIRHFPNGDMLSKQMLMEQLRKSHLPRIQAANPMVEKILQTTTTPALLQRPIQPLNLAQNWCAKCNATFRMTSDLVYHMRSHHKREFDPIKKKREDKLQCDVCKETFKERHHLTRHMTSHS